MLFTDVKRRKVETSGNGKVSIIVINRARIAVAPDWGLGWTRLRPRPPLRVTPKKLKNKKDYSEDLKCE